MNAPLHLPYLTGSLPGLGGLLKQAPEDFVVEEEPAYQPSGAGEHLFLLVEKRGITTREAVRHVAGRLGLAPERVGYAGLKDAHAVSRQWLSLHLREDPDPARLEGPNLAVLRAERHGNKLRRGHLRGNRFRIVVRETRAPADFEARWQDLARDGFPNYFGSQRFGKDGDNAAQGALIVGGRTLPRGKPEQVRFLINAYQSALFNELVAHRITELGRLDEPLAGDLAIFRQSRSFFSLDEAGLQDARQRMRAAEISPSAPLFGYKAPLASGRPGDWEEALLASQGLAPADFRCGGKRLSQQGERRPVRAFPQLHAWRQGKRNGLPCLELEFSLASGVYATAFLRELMKNDDLAHHPGLSVGPPREGARHAFRSS